jgi:hypothetical protein
MFTVCSNREDGACRSRNSIYCLRTIAAVSCDELGPKVGSVRLMKRTLDECGDEVWAPRDSDILNALLTAHYRCPIDLTGKIEGLQAVARALNKGDVPHACFVTIFLQFPDLPPFNNEAEDRYNELLASLRWSGLLKADEDWNRKHPRTNEPPNRGWFAPVPKDQKAPVPAEEAGNRRWPPKEANKYVRDWVEKTRPPLALQLQFCFDMSLSRGGLMSSSPV